MKLHLDELGKYINTNKITVYDIYGEGKKLPIYSSSEDQSIDETIEKAIETFNTMPSGVYLFKGKKSISSSNNTWQATDIIVGNSNESSSVKSNHQNGQRMQTYSQEDLEKHVKHATEMQRKDYELQECKRMFEDLKGKHNELRTVVNELIDDFTELLDVLNLEGIKGKGGVSKTITDGLTNVVEHGTKKVIDHFAGMEK